MRASSQVRAGVTAMGINVEIGVVFAFCVITFAVTLPLLERIARSKDYRDLSCVSASRGRRFALLPSSVTA